MAPTVLGRREPFFWGESLSETPIAWNVVKVENLHFKALLYPSPGSPFHLWFPPTALGGRRRDDCIRIRVLTSLCLEGS